MAIPRHSLWQNDPGIANAFRNAPSLRLGASGSAVRRLREALARMDAPAIPPAEEPDDQFQRLTKAQVETFQQLYGLGVDGIAGAGTFGKLDDLLMKGQGLKPWPSASKPSGGSFSGSKEEFLQSVASEGGPLVKALGWPVSAMLACAAVESGWGKGQIYSETKNLFSLQKWPKVVFPTTARTLWRTTVIQNTPRKTALAPFNTATSIADAVRQWCEWIQYYGSADGPPGNQEGRKVANSWAMSRRDQLLGMKANPVQFARSLYLVSFGENKATSENYGRVLAENNLTRFD